MTLVIISSLVILACGLYTYLVCKTAEDGMDSLRVKVHKLELEVRKLQNAHITNK